MPILMYCSSGHVYLTRFMTFIEEIAVDLNNCYSNCTQVAKYAASSKEEWEEQCKLWPTSYHPPT